MKVWTQLVSSEASPLVGDVHLLRVSLCGLFSVHLRPNLLFSPRHQSDWIRPTLRTSFYLNNFFKGPISKNSLILTRG